MMSVGYQVILLMLSVVARKTSGHLLLSAHHAKAFIKHARNCCFGCAPTMSLHSWSLVLYGGSHARLPALQPFRCMVVHGNTAT